jgi:hypothetical protein
MRSARKDWALQSKTMLSEKMWTEGTGEAADIL